MKLTTSFILESAGKGAFWRSVLLSAGMFLLLSFAGLSSSSEADEPLFMRSAQQLERLWGGVLGCTHPGDGAPRSTFETTFGGGGVPSAVDHDYVECGKRALRNTGSRMLVDTIEGAISQGGVALFSDRFRLDSSIAWVWEESVTGEIDAVIPLFSRERSDGTGQAIFIQPGAVFWQGLNSEERIDGNLGIAYRQHLTPGVVAGGSIFYDYDFKREGQRVGAGLDLQSGPLQAALNYYHPLNDWQEGRTDYEEQPLQGADFHFGLAWSRIQFDTSFGIWRFEGEEEESTKWRPAFEVGAGYRIYPGVFLQGGYENHDSEDSLDSRWNAGLKFRFSLPEFKGAVDDKVAAKPNLWEPVEREKRILYEEREAIPPVRLNPASAVDENGENVDPSMPLAQPIGDGGVTTVVIAGELEALPTEVMLDLVFDTEASSAELGVDFNYGHKVYVLNAETGEQSAPNDATDCPATTCEMTIPAGVTRFDIEVDILKDADSKEIREEIVLRADVPEEHQRMIRGGETRLTIEAHGNTVEFDTTNSDSDLDENGGTATVIVQIDEASPTPLQLTVTPGGGEAILNTDYLISATTLRIPANGDSATLTLTGIDNEVGEGPKRITLGLSGNLPTGWSFPAGGDSYEITLRDDDLAVGFTSSRILVEENVGNVELMVAPTQSLTGAAEIAWSVTAGSGELASTTATSGSLSFQSGADSNSPETITLEIMDDSNVEDAEEVVVTLTATTLPQDWSLGRETYTITIEPSDGVITFNPTSAITANEGETVEIGIRSTADGPSGGYPLTISIPNGSSDITFPATVTLPAGQKEQNFSITIRRDNTPESAENFTMSLSSSRSDDWTVSSARTINIPLNEGRISFASATGRAVEAGAPATTTITLEPAPASEVTVPITSSATGGVQYTLQSGGAEITNGVRVGTSGTATLTLMPTRDADTRGGTVTLRLGTALPEGYTAGARSSWAVTVDDSNTNIQPDRTITFEDSYSVVTEGGSTTSTTLIVTPSPDTDVAIPVVVTEDNGDEANYTLMAGSTAVTDSTTSITVGDTGRVTLTLSASSDTDDEGGHVTVALGDQLPELYFPGRRTSWLGIIWDDEAEPITFSTTSLNYDGTSTMTGTISAASNFPDATLVLENSDERGTIVDAPLSVDLPDGETSVTFQIVPLGGSGDATFKLTDPVGSLPFDWRIGSDDTLALTRTGAPSDNTINLSSSAINEVVEGSTLQLVVQALKGGGTADIPPEGINLSLTVDSIYMVQHRNPDRIVEHPGSDIPAAIYGFIPGFKRDGDLLPDDYRQALPSGEADPTAPKITNKYTFKLTEEYPSGNIFAFIEDDGITENPEKITFTLAAEGNLPNGWTLGTTTYEVTVPRHGERIGFVPNLPKRAVEGFTYIQSPANLPPELKKSVLIKGSPNDVEHLSLPFECVFFPGTQSSYTVNITGVDGEGGTISNIYNQVELTGNVVATRRFGCGGFGRVQTVDVGIRILEDNFTEGVQILTITVVPSTVPTSTVRGQLTHQLIVLPSDQAVEFSGRIVNDSTTGASAYAVTFNGTIPDQTQADKDDGIPLPSLLFVPHATDNEAAPGDYTLSISSGDEIVTIPAGVLNGEQQPEKYVWTLPTSSELPPTDLQLIVTPDTSNRVDLVLDIIAVDPALGWDVSGGKHTITVPLNP